MKIKSCYNYVICRAQGLCTQLGRNTFACVRQPSMGPTFGIKGGIDIDEYFLNLPIL